MRLEFNKLHDDAEILDEESKSKPAIPINASFHESENKIITQYRASMRNSLLSDYAPIPTAKKLLISDLKSIAKDSIPYSSQSTFQKLICWLTPFDIYFRKVWIPDCFIYPQILIASILITFCSMAYLGYKTLLFILNLSNFVDEGYDKVYTSAFQFIRTGLEKYFYMFKYEPTKDEFGHYFNQLDDVGKRIHEFSIAVKIGAIIGLVVAVLAILGNFLWILSDFKQRVLKARKGVYEFNRFKVPIEANMFLPAAIISNSVFMYFLLMIVTTLACSVLWWSVTYKVLWKIKWILLDSILGIIINFLFRIVLNKLCYTFQDVKRRWLLGIFDFILLNITILAGLVMALKRFGILFGILFVSLFRIDVNSMPTWISRYLYLDTFNKGTDFNFKLLYRILCINFDPSLPK